MWYIPSYRSMTNIGSGPNSVQQRERDNIIGDDKDNKEIL